VARDAEVGRGRKLASEIVLPVRRCGPLKASDLDPTLGTNPAAAACNRYVASGKTVTLVAGARPLDRPHNQNIGFDDRHARFRVQQRAWNNESLAQGGRGDNVNS
jgi:hypothetical protein